MKLPPGVTEDAFLEAVNSVADLLAHHFKFGIYDADDIRQQAALFGIEAMGEGTKYDPKRPLPNFIFSHVRNRLLNLKRNKLRRSDPPCRECHEALPGQTTHPDRQYCKRYSSWLKLNLAKSSLMCPMELSAVTNDRESCESEVVETVETDEILRKIDRELPVELRSDYLRMRAGESVPKATRSHIEQVVLRIIGEVA